MFVMGRTGNTTKIFGYADRPRILLEYLLTF